MKALDSFPTAVAKRVKYVFSDIDDTITTDGFITERAFSALWRARNRGLGVVLVTGRPAGWCDHLVRMWPVEAVVGENGALVFALRDGRIQRQYADRPADAEKRLERIRQQVEQEVEGCKIAADQAYREYDLAIDFCEEVEALPKEAVDHIVSIFEEHGATAKVSSIHVNGWFGDFDKLTMCKRWAVTWGPGRLDPEAAIYVGDSPNDEPMFRYFTHACGVANVSHFADRMQYLPAYIAPSAGGEGFAEVIDRLLEARGG